VRFPVSDCSDPLQRLAVATRPASKLSVSDPLASGATLVVLTEDTVNVLGMFPPRPARFRLPSKPEGLEGCCDTPVGPAYAFSFRDHRRNFEAYIFARNLRTRAVRVDALAILDSLRFARRQ